VFEIALPLLPPAGEARTSLERHVGSHSISQPFVGELPSVRLVGQYPMPIYGRQLVLEAIGRPDVALLNLVYTIAGGGRIKPTAQKQTIECAVILHNRWNRGYFHWVAETLTRLEGVERYRERTGRQPTLILGPNPPPFQTESLRLLGYNEDDWLEWDGTTTVVNRLVVPSMRREIHRGYVASPFATDWLRDRVGTAATDQIDSDRFSPRVYISRSDADSRRIVNETDVMELLSTYGFEAYRLAEMSVAETVALFSQADLIVSPHGAGLTDVLYANDASVVELFRGTNNPDVYFILAQQVGHRYRYLRCEPTGVDLTVDLAELDAIIAEELAAIVE
jgi:capsular polysaccharide biosynthesis protein